MQIGSARRNQDTGRMEIDLLKVDDIEISWLHEASRNYKPDPDDEARGKARLRIKDAIDLAWDKVR